MEIVFKRWSKKKFSDSFQMAKLRKLQKAAIKIY